MTTETIIAEGYIAAYTMVVYRNTRFVKPFTMSMLSTGDPIDLQGKKILYTAKEVGAKDTDEPIISVDVEVPAVDSDGALGIFTLEIPELQTDVDAVTYDSEFMYEVAGTHYPIIKFKTKVIQDLKRSV